MHFVPRTEIAPCFAAQNRELSDEQRYSQALQEHCRNFIYHQRTHSDSSERYYCDLVGSDGIKRFWQLLDYKPSSFIPQSMVCTPKPEAISQIGIVYLGDSKSPEHVFTNGFSSRTHPNIDSDKALYEALLDIHIEEKVGSSRLGTMATCQETAVCCSTSLTSALNSLSTEGEISETYVYCCYAPVGVKLYETVQQFDHRYNNLESITAAKETLVAKIEPEHVIKAWKIQKRTLRIKESEIDKFTQLEVSENPSIDECVKMYFARVNPELPKQLPFLIPHNTLGSVVRKRVK
ncbi:hypothetical protein D5018_07775 [Parashewanella curva]|uniref:Uncharacterized protein n=1 Tax=Parashewanella curva TaxID=2338552 RepID=A0A3L8PY80_9GAMM|nr:hypothetical protein [Parashewanella curva]RLV60284.1 hypothetical protein D5018_07775 [Parashewanella curva]